MVKIPVADVTVRVSSFLDQSPEAAEEGDATVTVEQAQPTTDGEAEVTGGDEAMTTSEEAEAATTTSDGSADTIGPWQPVSPIEQARAVLNEGASTVDASVATSESDEAAASDEQAVKTEGEEAGPIHHDVYLLQVASVTDLQVVGAAKERGERGNRWRIGGKSPASRSSESRPSNSSQNVSSNSSASDYEMRHQELQSQLREGKGDLPEVHRDSMPKSFVEEGSLEDVEEHAEKASKGGPTEDPISLDLGDDDDGGGDQGNSGMVHVSKPSVHFEVKRFSSKNGPFHSKRMRKRRRKRLETYEGAPSVFPDVDRHN